MNNNEIKMYAKVFLGLDVQITESGAVAFNRGQEPCIYPKQIFIDKYLNALSDISEKQEL